MSSRARPWPPTTTVWVEKLVPSGLQGSELLEAERVMSKLVRLSVWKGGDPQKNLNTGNPQSQAGTRSVSRLLSKPNREISNSPCQSKKASATFDRHKWSKNEYETASELTAEPSPCGLHASMFLMTLLNQGTPEQHQLVLEGREVRDYQMLRSTRVGSWLQCRRSRSVRLSDDTSTRAGSWLQCHRS